MNLDAKTLVIVIAAGAAAYLGLRYGRQAVSAASSALEAINPASSNNLAYRGANSIVQTVTNDPYATLGTKVWEWMNPASVAAEKMMLTGESAYAPNAAAIWTALDQEDADFGAYSRMNDGVSTGFPWMSQQFIQGNAARLGGAGFRGAGASGSW
ncbi:MAG TPA: hypothetical protein VED01_07815 [Burkholderiales bacterium]|nr:hypothetical protein [Burkholderiales bacterium]